MNNCLKLRKKKKKREKNKSFQRELNKKKNTKM